MAGTFKSVNMGLACIDCIGRMIPEMIIEYISGMLPQKKDKLELVPDFWVKKLSDKLEPELKDVLMLEDNPERRLKILLKLIDNPEDRLELLSKLEDMLNDTLKFMVDPWQIVGPPSDIKPAVEPEPAVELELSTNFKLEIVCRLKLELELELNQSKTVNRLPDSFALAESITNSCCC
jgi:hypothetical protein